MDKFQWNIGGKFEQARFETANRPDAEENILIRSSDKKFNIYEIYSDISYQINNYFTCYAGLNFQYYNGNLKNFLPEQYSPFQKTDSLSGPTMPKRHNI